MFFFPFSWNGTPVISSTFFAFSWRKYEINEIAAVLPHFRLGSVKWWISCDVLYGQNSNSKDNTLTKWNNNILLNSPIHSVARVFFIESRPSQCKTITLPNYRTNNAIPPKYNSNKNVPLFHLRSSWYIRAIEVNKSGTQQHIIVIQKEKNCAGNQMSAYKNSYTRLLFNACWFIVCMHQMTRYILHRVCHRIMLQLPLHTLIHGLASTHARSLDTLLLIPIYCFHSRARTTEFPFRHTGRFGSRIKAENVHFDYGSCVNWICRCGTG